MLLLRAPICTACGACSPPIALPHEDQAQLMLVTGRILPEGHF